MTRRFLGFVLALILTAFLLPVSAFAETIGLDAPLWLQKDERWRDVFLNVDAGGKELTIGKAGCTLCCLASAESVRTGRDVTPFDMLFRVRFSGDELQWPKGYEAIARSSGGMLVRQAGPILLACLRSGRPALVCLHSPERGTHWVLVYGCRDLDPENPQTAHFLIRDPANRDRTTFNMAKEYFPEIRVIRTYDVTDELREAAALAMEAE